MDAFVACAAVASVSFRMEKKKNKKHTSSNRRKTGKENTIPFCLPFANFSCFLRISLQFFFLCFFLFCSWPTQSRHRCTSHSPHALESEGAEWAGRSAVDGSAFLGHPDFQSRDTEMRILKGIWRDFWAEIWRNPNAADPTVPTMPGSNPPFSAL